MCRTPSAFPATVGHEESPQSSPQCPDCSRRAALCEAALPFGVKIALIAAARARNGQIGAKNGQISTGRAQILSIGAKTVQKSAETGYNEEIGAKTNDFGAEFMGFWYICIYETNHINRGGIARLRNLFR